MTVFRSELSSAISLTALGMVLLRQAAWRATQDSADGPSAGAILVAVVAALALATYAFVRARRSWRNRRAVRDADLGRVFR